MRRKDSMGKVYRPEDLTGKPPRETQDLTVKPPTPLIRPDLESLHREIESLRREIDRIKQALKDHGITVE